MGWDSLIPQGEENWILPVQMSQQFYKFEISCLHS